MKIINKTKIVNIIISVFLILFSKVFLASLFDFTINTNVYLLILGVIMYFVIFDPTDKQKLPINAFFLIIIFGTIISVVKPVQYGLDEESHLPNVISVSDSPIFKYSKEKLTDYDSVFEIILPIFHPIELGIYAGLSNPVLTPLILLFLCSTFNQ